jgi:hypothetical protein
MKRILFFVLAAAGAYYVTQQPDAAFQDHATPSTFVAPVAQPSAQWRSGQQVSGTGTVSRILSDDNEGSRHQRFILRLGTGQTLLVAHNIDLAPRVPSLREGDTVSFYGEYEPSAQGGVIHWTHSDPAGRHTAGWLEHEGRRYQ